VAVWEGSNFVQRLLLAPFTKQFVLFAILLGHGRQRSIHKAGEPGLPMTARTSETPAWVRRGFYAPRDGMGA
jgi:hypothetical protein